MRRQKKLDNKTLEKARKEKERIFFLQEKIRKAQKEIDDIKESNNWMAYLDKGFCDDATEEQQIEFFNDLIYKIR